MNGWPRSIDAIENLEITCITPDSIQEAVVSVFQFLASRSVFRFGTLHWRNCGLEPSVTISIQEPEINADEPLSEKLPHETRNLVMCPFADGRLWGSRKYPSVP